MSDNVMIVLVIAIALIVILFIFRKQLSNFHFRGGRDGVDMELKTRKETSTAASAQSGRKSSGTSVSRNTLWGRKNKINVQNSGKASVDENKVVGEEQEINVGPETRGGSE